MTRIYRHKVIRRPGDWTEPFFETFPNAISHHGHHGVDIEWDDHHIICTEDDTDEIMVGLYLDGGWIEGDEPHIIRKLTPKAAFEYVDFITDTHPEGTDWGAWAVQWTADNIEP